MDKLISPQTVEAVFFDLDGTLRHSRPSPTNLFLDHAVRLGALDSIDKRRQAMRWAHHYWADSPELKSDRNNFDGHDDLFWENYAHHYLIAYGCPAEQAMSLAPKVNKLMIDGYTPEDWVPPDVPETLEAFRAAGFTLGLVSNRSNPVHEELETLELMTYFNFVLTAGEVNSWKPDPQIFHHALKQSKSDPGRTVYVGDNYYADIIGARNAGLQPILIDPDGIFPDADCTVIQSIGELQSILLS